MINPSSSSACPIAVDPSVDHEDHQPHHQFNFLPNYPYAASSSYSVSCHALFNSSESDQAGYNYYLNEMPHQLQEVENHMNASYHVLGSDDPEKKEANRSGQLKLSLNMWKNQSEQMHSTHDHQENIQVQGMSSKMRLTQKMRNNNKSERKEIISSNTTTTSSTIFQPGSSSSPDETHDHLSSCSTNMSYHSSNPVRVCADCNTTKTPLWRSGPKGPKSLCNACGIRQRKARRAAMAAAAAHVTSVTSAKSSCDKPTAAVMKMKVQNKVKQFKKRSKLMKKTSKAESSQSQSESRDHIKKKKGSFEDFLFDLSKNLAAFHRVFPQDEKEAAILLMALSCGLVHG